MVNKEKAIIYARVSSKEQEISGFSIPAQIDILNKYCSDHNFEVIKVFTESHSAKETGTRPVYNEMIKFLRKQKTRYHLVYEKNDRLLRNEYDSADIINLARTTPHHIHSVREMLELYKTAHPSVFFVFTMFSANSSIYSRNLSIEVRKGLNKSADLGYYPGAKLPVGYKRGDYIPGEKKKRAVIIDTEKAGYILKAFELYSTGMFSYDTLAKKLASEGFIIKKNPCTKRNIELILNNPFYIGEYIFNGKRYNFAHYTPIVSKELFLVVQNIIKGNTASYKENRQFLYSQMIKCGTCGASLVGEIKKGKYIYYGCRGRKCTIKKQKWLKEEIVDEVVDEMILSLSIPEENAKKILEQLKLTVSSQFEYEETMHQNIEKEISLYKKRINSIYLDKIDGNISEEFYIEKRDEFQNRLDELTLSSYQNIIKTDEIMEKVDMCIELLKNAHSKYLTYSIDKKQYMLKLLVSNFIYDDKNLHANLKSTTKSLLDSAYSENWWRLGDSNS